VVNVPLFASTSDVEQIGLQLSLESVRSLSRHLALLKKQSDAACPLCEDEQETGLHFLGRCSATMVRRIQYFERPFLIPCELRQEHWDCQNL